MPHIKFYHYEAWEMDEYKQQQERERRKRQREVDDLEIVPDTFNDEEERRKDRKRQKEDQERREFEVLRRQMTIDAEKRESMIRQSELQLELQQAHRRGDTDTVRKLERMLAPDQVGPTIKHPWA